MTLPAPPCRAEPPGPASTAAVITGLGGCLPPTKITNGQLVREGLDTSDEWIRTRTGIRTRHRAGPGVSTADLAVAAGRAALHSASRTQTGIVLVATTTPDRLCPATGPEVATRLGLTGTPAFDISAVCSGFLYAANVASALLTSGAFDSALVIGAETYSTIIDPRDRNTAVIFGDGAGAVCLERGSAADPGAFLRFDLGSDGARSDLIAIADGGSRSPHRGEPPPADRFFRMRGPEVYKQAVLRMTSSARTVLALAEWPLPAVEAFIGHQANQRILDAVAQRLRVPPERCHGNLRHVGNTAAASIPLAMADAAARHVVEPGARTLLTAFGGGLTWASAAMTWPAAATTYLLPERRPPQGDHHE
ncbi:beta-ketoacyl-ACP synthase III [Streptomyces sp. NPDC000134]|uniref:beta-ketoacyl-ACP synthase III n=1 Tax=Streptomyces sp. NPDC000134 TaxID=3364536 RepID=UPI0036D0D2E1